MRRSAPGGVTSLLTQGEGGFLVAIIGDAEMRNEELILQQLRARGECSLEELPRLTGLDWATVFAVVDYLNRAGVVVLKKERSDYRVTLERRI